MSLRNVTQGAPSFLLSAVFTGMAALIGSKVGIVLGRGLNVSDDTINMIGNAGAPVAAVAAGVGVSYMAGKLHAPVVAKQGTILGAMVVAAPLVYSGMTGDPVITFNYKSDKNVQAPAEATVTDFIDYYYPKFQDSIISLQSELTSAPDGP